MSSSKLSSYAGGNLNLATHHFEAIADGAVIGRFSNVQTAARTACWTAYVNDTHNVFVRDTLSILRHDYHACMVVVGRADLELEQAAAKLAMGQHNYA